MARAKPKGLTHKQAAFAAEYVHTKGNGTKAALRAGYSAPSAASIASENLRKPKVSQRIAMLTRRHEISAERVLTRLDNLSMQAEANGNHAAAIKAEELLGKSLGMWVERSMSVTVDMTSAHLEALKSLMDKRSEATTAQENGEYSGTLALDGQSHRVDAD